jgi:hypothetical protein
VQMVGFTQPNSTLKAVYQAFYTVSQMHCVEIDQQANSIPAELEIAEQLSTVQWDNFFDGFQFDDDAILHDRSRR